MASLATEGECDPVDSGNAPAVAEGLLKWMIDEWRRCLKEEIEKNFEVSPPTLKLYNKLRKVWVDFNDCQLTLEAKINKFVGTSSI